VVGLAGLAWLVGSLLWRARGRATLAEIMRRQREATPGYRLCVECRRRIALLVCTPHHLALCGVCAWQHNVVGECSYTLQEEPPPALREKVCE